MTYKEQLNNRFHAVATQKFADEYAATDDKFIFCIDLLDLSLVDDGDRFCTKWVEALEDRFERYV